MGRRSTVFGTGVRLHRRQRAFVVDVGRGVALCPCCGGRACPACSVLNGCVAVHARGFVCPWWRGVEPVV